MKVLMTADGVGGVWTYAVELARGLGPHGVEILLATSGGPLSDGQRGEIATLPHVRLVETRYKLEWMPDPWEDVAAFGRLLRDLAADFRPDVVHLNEFSHGALGWDVPTLVVGHSCVSSWFESVRGYAPGPEWDRYRKSVTRGLRAADLVAAPTRFMLTALERHYGPFAGSRVLPNGYSPTALSSTSPVGNALRGVPSRLDALTGEAERHGGRSLHSERREPFVFAAGRWWDEAKNVAALGRIASRLPWPVRVAGLPAPDGSATALPENIENLGRLGPEAMRERYARAAIYCLPARYEPFGLTPLEAACHGCALVLGDIPSLREVWGDAAAFVSPDDVDSLADTLNHLITDDEARDDLARRGRERAARFSRERMTRGYVEAYRELCGVTTTNCHQSRSAVTAREGVGMLPRGRG